MLHRLDLLLDEPRLDELLLDLDDVQEVDLLDFALLDFVNVGFGVGFRVGLLVRISVGVAVTTGGGRVTSTVGDNV